MPATRAKMTEEEFMRLPDDGRKYELVNGRPKEVPTSFRHNAIGANIVALLMPYARGRGFLAISQAGFGMKDHNIRCPDVSFTRKERLPSGVPPDTFGDAAPDLCIEIVSPSEDQDDMKLKLGEYFASGSQQVWYLFPESRRVAIYTAPTKAITYDADDEISADDLLPGFHCRVTDLFSLE